MSDDITLDLNEAAALLKMSPEALRRKTKAGEMPGTKIGKRWCLEYVGESTNICERLIQHERNGVFKFNKFWPITGFPNLFRTYVKAIYIHALQPPANDLYPILAPWMGQHLSTIECANTK